MGDYYKREWKLRAAYRPRVLYLCEGDSEAEYVDTWLQSRGENNSEIGVLCFEGLSKIDSKVKVLVMEPNFRSVDSICVFLDAETNLNQRKNNVKNMLKNLGFPHLNSNQVPWIESNAGKKSCVFISPDMQSPGRIENIVMNEIRGNQNIFNCIDNFKNCSLNAGVASFDEKQFVNTFINLHKPGIGLGASFQKGVFDTSHNAYSDLNNLLENAII